MRASKLFYWLMMLCCYLSEGHCATLEMYCSVYRVPKKQDPDRKLMVVLLVVMLLSFRESMCHPRDVLFWLPSAKEAGPRQETDGGSTGCNVVIFQRVTVPP